MLILLIWNKVDIACFVSANIYDFNFEELVSYFWFEKIFAIFFRVSLKNIENLKFTGNKFENKKYYRHTGYPGGIKEITPSRLSKKKPEEILRLAVKRMLPGGPLAKKQLTKLKMYVGNNHPHSAQNPKVLDILSLNKKNLIKS